MTVLWDPWTFNGVVSYLVVLGLLFTLAVALFKIFMPDGLDGLW